MATTMSNQSSPSLSDLMGQLSALSNPAMDTYKREMQAAQSLKSIDPSVLQQAVSAGGPLSAAESFADSSAWAMTPEMFKMTMQNRPDAMKMASDATTLSDAIFGRTAERRAMEEVAGAKASMAKQNLGSAVQQSEGMQSRQQQMAIADKELAARAKEGQLNRTHAERMEGIRQAGRERLARVAMSGSQNDPYANLARAGVPLHTSKDIAELNKIITSKTASKSDKANANESLVQMGFYKPGPQGIIKISEPGFFGTSSTYRVSKDPRTGIDYVLKQVGESGDINKDWTILGPMSQKLPDNYGAGRSNSSSMPYFMTEGE